MAVLAATAQTFAQTVQRTGVVIVDWWAGWCAPCRAFAPIFAAAAERHGDVTFVKIDADAQRGLADACRIEVLPTLTVFRDGRFLCSRSGELEEPALEELLREVRGAGGG